MGTRIGKEVRCDNPVARVEAMKGVCNGNKRRADDCGLDS